MDTLALQARAQTHTQSIFVLIVESQVSYSHISFLL